MINPNELVRISPRDGDVFVLPADTPAEVARQLAEAIHVASPGIKAMVFCGELRQLDTAAMNAAGWYRA
jgi:hypothetical protein